MRVFRIYDAANIRKPPYVEEHERAYQRTGREASSSAKRLMAKRLKPWYERWSSP